MKIVAEFPKRVRVIENVWIPLSDGIRLAARIWLPKDAEVRPVPALLEYLPYRKRDSTRMRDEPMHHYQAGHGYASVRVDIRGSGDSDGLIHDEYLHQEQDDALEVIAWIARQPWCSGNVGMFGISWGGFNALQVAARRPPALKAIVTLGSTDDRYATDVHYMGGCLIKDSFEWGAVIFSWLSLPPDPEIVGERWREMWMARLENLQPWLVPWLEHQRRDAYWKHGSVCEDFSLIQVPVYAVSGWGDQYATAVPRLLAGLRCPRKGLIGPWAHKYPHIGTPGPAIGWLQEALRWWDHWMKGADTGIMDEPMLRVWMPESVRPAACYAERPGRWVAEDSWPSPRIAWQDYVLNPCELSTASSEETPLVLASPLTVGLAGGETGRFGSGAEFPTDQRADDGGSLVFTSAPLPERIEILGAPLADLQVRSNRANALICVRLNDVAPDGSSTRVTYGLLNLTHRNSHEFTEPLLPDERYRVRFPLEDVAYAFPPGHRLAVSVSTAYWPIAWPSPEPVTLTLFAGASRIALPLRQPRSKDEAPPPFASPEMGPEAPHTVLDTGRETNSVLTRDALAGTTTFHMPRDWGTIRLEEINLLKYGKGDVHYCIANDNPASALAWTAFALQRRRGTWHVRTEARMRLACTTDEFHLQAEIDAWEGERKVFTRTWDQRFARDFV